MMQPLDYSTPSTPREKTDWRWGLVPAELLILAGGAGLVMCLELTAPVRVTDWLRATLLMIVLLALPLLGAHCVGIVITRKWVRRRQTHVMIGLPTIVASALILLIWTNNTDRQRFCRYVMDPIPPSVVVDRVVGFSGFDESWVVVFQVSSSDFQSLVRTQGLKGPLSPPNQMTTSEIEGHLEESIPTSDHMQEYGAGPGGGNVLRSVIYNPTTGRAYYLYTTF